jgi:predicted membrane protein
LGIHVANKGDVIQVFQLKPTHSPDIKVLVPKNVIISYKFDSQYGGDVRFQKVTNEIEVSALYNSIKLDEVTGPLTIQTTYGSVTANFAAPIKDPVSIVSIYGFVDVTIPQATKADLKLSTSYGDIYVAPEFNLQVATRDGMAVYSDKISGKINGGGVSMDLDCNYGKIYLIKK